MHWHARTCWLLLAPAGSADGRHDRVVVRVSGALRGVRDVADVSIEAGGRLLRLADFATVRSATGDPASFTIRHNGVPVLAIGVTMVANGNILALGEALEARMAEVRAALPVGVQVDKYADQPRIVADSVWEFWNLDRISLGALIIALGLLVDDAIIAVEMMVVKLEEGWDRIRAATFACSSTAFPMLTGTLVTLAGSCPSGSPGRSRASTPAASSGSWASR
jgi:multidrug efflux pump subunit AcrB